MPAKKVLLASAVCAGIAAVSFAPVARAWKKYDAQKRKAQVAAAFDAVKRGADTVKWPRSEEAGGRERGPEHDDPQLRRLADLAYWGDRGPAFQASRAKIAQQEAKKWAKLMPKTRSGRQQRSLIPDASGPVFYNLGPDRANQQWNSEYYNGNDSGRLTAIRVDPGDPTGNTVFVATSGGGVWMTSDAFDSQPQWTSITDACLPNLAVGAFEVYQGVAELPSRALIIGLGDAFDVKGGQVVTVVGDPANCDNWHMTDPLAGPIVGDTALFASSIRDLRFDPVTDKVWATTDVGIFLGTYSPGSSMYEFNYVNATNSLESGPFAAWNLAYLGNNGGSQSSWAVSIVYADGNSPPPQAGFGCGPASPASLCGGANNPGDIIYTIDSGGNWTSMRQQGRLPPAPQDQVGSNNDYGRMFVAVGPIAKEPNLGAPKGAVIVGSGADAPLDTQMWIQAGNSDETNTFFLAYLKGSINGGLAIKASPLPPAQTSAGPAGDWPVAATNASTDCTDVGLGFPGGFQQAWYNQQVIVDPQDDKHALFGGAECSMRTIDDGATYQISSDWLPNFAGALDDGGNPVPPLLPYVHADWHAGAAFVDGNGNSVVLVGSDGGFFISPGGPRNVFQVAGTSTADLGCTNPPLCDSGILWTQPDTGLITDLFYSVGSGDPTLGSQQHLVGGLQDNGTRYRVNDYPDLAFNQVVGGDGVGTAISAGPVGENETVWTSVPGGRAWCKPGEMKVQGNTEFGTGAPLPLGTPIGPIDCRQSTTPNSGPPVDQIDNWQFVSLPLSDFDSEVFHERLQPIDDGKGSVMAASSLTVWKLTVDAQDNLQTTQLSTSFYDAFDFLVGNVPTVVGVRNIYASPNTYNIPDALGASHQVKLFGALLGNGNTAVATQIDGRIGSFIQSDFATYDQDFHNPIAGTASMDFPAPQVEQFDPNTGKPLIYIVSSVLAAPVTSRVFLTTDGGFDWTSLQGDLPLVPVDVVRFDPADPSGNTIYAGTDIGLYRTTDANNLETGPHWSRFGVGLPLVRVTDMTIARNGGLVRIATYGRGLWEVYPHDITPPAGPGITGDWDQNGQVDWVDLAALASRLGTSPGQNVDNSAPHYDWTVDFGLPDPSGGGGACDGVERPCVSDADLSQLVANFGVTQ